jgi:hypothetical protein
MLDMLSADVSMYTRCGLFSGESLERVEVRLISNQHGNDMWTCVLAHLFDPGFDVAKK